MHIQSPVPVKGALYVTPERLPGFARTSVVKATVLRMVVSSQVEDLLPAWASFVRGVLELPACRPTASREDLVRDAAFMQARMAIENSLFEHFERSANDRKSQFPALVAWHRYMWAGHALSQPRLRKILSNTYAFQTSHGPLTFDEIVSRSRANALVESDFDHVIWFNPDRRQERWISTLFAEHDVPCVHTTRSFEESLLAMMASDLQGASIDLRITSPSSTHFAESILGMREVTEVSSTWQDFLQSLDARILSAEFRDNVPVMSFLNESADLQQAFEEIRKHGNVPPAFQRIIDRQLEQASTARNEVILNRNHRLVARALSQRTSSPLAGVLRILVMQSLNAAGARYYPKVHSDCRPRIWIGSQTLFGAATANGLLKRGVAPFM